MPNAVYGSQPGDSLSTRNMKDAVEALRNVYREQAIAHKDGTESGDYRAGNRAHEKLYRAYYGLKDAEAERVLLELLDDSNASA